MASLIANSACARAMRLTLIAALTTSAAGHASMIMPPSRNAIDSELPPWSHGQHPETGMIEPYAEQFLRNSVSCLRNSLKPHDVLQVQLWLHERQRARVQLGPVVLLVLAGLHDRLRGVRRRRPALPVVRPLPGHAEQAGAALPREKVLERQPGRRAGLPPGHLAV